MGSDTIANVGVIEVAVGDAVSSGKKTGILRDGSASTKTVSGLTVPLSSSLVVEGVMEVDMVVRVGTDDLVSGIPSSVGVKNDIDVDRV